jgi:hypothetical protein
MPLYLLLSTCLFDEKFDEVSGENVARCDERSYLRDTTGDDVGNHISWLQDGE